MVFELFVVLGYQQYFLYGFLPGEAISKTKAKGY